MISQNNVYYFSNNQKVYNEAIVDSKLVSKYNYLVGKVLNLIGISKKIDIGNDKNRLYSIYVNKTDLKIYKAITLDDLGDYVTIIQPSLFEKILRIYKQIYIKDKHPSIENEYVIKKIYITHNSYTILKNKKLREENDFLKKELGSTKPNNLNDILDPNEFPVGMKALYDSYVDWNKENALTDLQNILNNVRKQLVGLNNAKNGIEIGKTFVITSDCYQYAPNKTIPLVLSYLLLKDKNMCYIANRNGWYTVFPSVEAKNAFLQSTLASGFVNEGETTFESLMNGERPASS